MVYLVQKPLGNRGIVRQSDLEEAAHVFGQLRAIERVETPSFINNFLQNRDQDYPGIISFCQ
jgi:hypothetical protein